MVIIHNLPSNNKSKKIKKINRIILINTMIPKIDPL